MFLNEKPFFEIIGNLSENRSLSIYIFIGNSSFIKSFIELKIQSKKFSIIQRLCDENPDVDAIYRLINKKIDISDNPNEESLHYQKKYFLFQFH